MSLNYQGAGPGAPLTLTQAASLVQGRLDGDGSIQIHGLAPLDEAGPGEMAFLAMKRYGRLLRTSSAGAYLVSSEFEYLIPTGASKVIVDKPYPALRELLLYFGDEAVLRPEVHDTAVIGSRVRLGSGVRIEPFVVIEDGVSIGDGTRLGSHSVVGSNSTVGRDSILHAHVVIYPRSVIGSNVVLHSGTRIGSDGFGYTEIEGIHRKIPHIGRAIIEDNVEIGSNTTVDRGSFGDTRVGTGTKIDNLVQVAHNVQIGARSLLAALVGIAGSTRIGKGVWMGGRASATNHLEIGDAAQVAFDSTVMKDIQAGETGSGSPARPHREQLRRQANVHRLGKLQERVEVLEAGSGESG